MPLSSAQVHAATGPRRLQLLRIAPASWFQAQDVAQRISLSPSSVSAHLRVLHNVNLLDFETRGRDRGRPTHLYRLREDARILLSALDELAQSVVPVPLARPPRRYAVVALIDEDALSPELFEGRSDFSIYATLRDRLSGSMPTLALSVSPIEPELRSAPEGNRRRTEKSRGGVAHRNAERRTSPVDAGGVLGEFW